jgi:hypothetical protein
MGALQTIREDIALVACSNISCVKNNDAFFAPSYVSLCLSLYIYVIDVIGSDAEQHTERQMETKDRPRRK